MIDSIDVSLKLRLEQLVKVCPSKFTYFIKNNDFLIPLLDPLTHGDNSGTPSVVLFFFVCVCYVSFFFFLKEMRVMSE